MIVIIIEIIVRMIANNCTDDNNPHYYHYPSFTTSTYEYHIILDHLPASPLSSILLGRKNLNTTDVYLGLSKYMEIACKLTDTEQQRARPQVTAWSRPTRSPNAFVTSTDAREMTDGRLLSAAIQ